MNAAGPWTSLSKSVPAPGRPYLIAAKFGGIETYDVAFYNGRRKDGDHWWTLANIEIDQSCIEFWAEIVALASKERGRK